MIEYGATAETRLYPNTVMPDDPIIVGGNDYQVGATFLPGGTIPDNQPDAPNVAGLPVSCEPYPGCTCYDDDLHCIPDWDGRGLPSLAWTKAVWGMGAHYARRFGFDWQRASPTLTDAMVLDVMMWARDFGLDPSIRPGDGATIHKRFEEITGKNVETLRQDAIAADPTVLDIPGGGSVRFYDPNDPHRRDSDPSQPAPSPVALPTEPFVETVILPPRRTAVQAASLSLDPLPLMMLAVGLGGLYYATKPKQKKTTRKKTKKTTRKKKT